MSTIVFQAAGAVGGFLIGGPTGAQYGWALGGIIGGALQPPQELPPTFGPRLGDLKIQSATYGMALPRCYGTVRIAGNIIWTTDIIETPTVTVVESGGKGGGGSEQTQTTYSYSQSLAVGICEGEIVGIRRIWGNGKLIFSYADDASSDTLLVSTTAPITVYLGTESQSPSALQESYLGTGNVPAYRGTAYVEFTDLQLEAFGNRTPNLEFEVVVDGSANGTSSATSLYDGGATTGSAYVIFSRQNGIVWYQDNSNLTPLIAVDIDGPTQLLSRAMSASEKIIPMWVDDSDGSVWGWQYNNGAASTVLRNVSTSGTITDRTANFGILFPNSGWNIAVGFDESGNPWFADSTFSTIYRCVIALTTCTLTAISSSSTCRIMMLGGNYPSRMYWFAAATWGYFNTNTLAKTVLFTTGGGSISQALLDYERGYVYVQDGNDATTLRRYTVDGDLVDTVTLTGNTSFSSMALDDIGYLYVKGSSNVFRIDAGAWTLQATIATSLIMMRERSFNGYAALFYNDGTNQFEIFALYSLNLVTAGSGDLAEIVSDLCQLSDLTASDVDVTGLSGVEVDGYVVSAVGPIRGMIEPLQQVYFFDAVESDDDIKFIRRGGSAAVTIPQTDLSAHESGDAPPPLTITRMEETELPAEAVLTYMARQNNYQPGTQRERRQTTQSQRKMQLAVPIVMTDDKAQQTADAILYSAWQERSVVEFATSRKYAKYEPTDVLGVTVGSNTFRIRATHRDVGGNGIIRWSGVIEDASTYTQTSTGATMIEPSNEIVLPSSGVLELLDTPLLRDVDDAVPGHYMAVCGAEYDAWRGQQLYRSSDGTNYDAAANAQTVAPAIIGAATTVLATCSRPGMFDEGNSVTVQLEDGLTLASATRAEVLNGANAAALGNNTTGWEIIQFRTATQTSPATDGLYTLTGLLRGRLGTEALMSTHAIGDRFVLLDTRIRAITQGWSDVNREFTYKSVSFGRTLAQTAAETFTNTARSKKPLAPVQLVAGRNGSGDWLIAWRRRTRLNATWRDEIDAPLGEATEAYAVDVMNGSTVVRTIEATTNEATYTAAEWLSDFSGSPTATTITINVYQISSEYGYGDAATGTFA